MARDAHVGYTVKIRDHESSGTLLPPSLVHRCFFVLVCHRYALCARQRETALSQSADLSTGNQAGLWDRPVSYHNERNLTQALGAYCAKDNRLSRDQCALLISLTVSTALYTEYSRSSAYSFIYGILSII